MTGHNPVKDAFNTILDYILDLEAKLETQAQVYEVRIEALQKQIDTQKESK